MRWFRALCNLVKLASRVTVLEAQELASRVTALEAQVKLIEETYTIDANLDFARSIKHLTQRVRSLEENREDKLGLTRFAPRW